MIVVYYLGVVSALKTENLLLCLFNNDAFHNIAVYRPVFTDNGTAHLYRRNSRDTRGVLKRDPRGLSVFHGLLPAI